MEGKKFLLNGKEPFIRALRLRPLPLLQHEAYYVLTWSHWTFQLNCFISVVGNLHLLTTLFFFQLSPNAIYPFGATKSFIGWRSCLTLGIGVSPGVTYSFLGSHHERFSTRNIAYGHVLLSDVQDVEGPFESVFLPFLRVHSSS